MADEPEGIPPKTITPPVQGVSRRPRLSKLNFILLVGVIIIGMFLYKAEQQRREVASKLEQTSTELESVRSATKNDTAAVAQDVLQKVRKHIVVPENPLPTVASIVDIDSLKRANSFYEPASNGDYLIITERRAVLYDADADIVLDVVPVQTSGSRNTPTATPANDNTAINTPAALTAPVPARTAASPTPPP
ncbi:MAG: hypothetical protein HY372_03570 [Candidatus Andersenbacteria bacterium]|nr:hypothetical protein [Candidatus Andersenbacteria bacterium]